jgi:hypothetical protein
MPKPKDIMEKYARILSAWQTLAPSKSFGGMTVQQFEEACFPSKEMRGLIETLQAQMTQAINSRDAADDGTSAKIQQVVAGVLADPAYGPDSDLYEAFGYTRKSERKAGRPHKDDAPPSN